MVDVHSEVRRGELLWSFIWEVAHPVSDRTQPCVTSVKLMELAGPIGHSLTPHYVCLDTSTSTPIEEQCTSQCSPPFFNSFIIVDTPLDTE